MSISVAITRQKDLHVFERSYKRQIVTDAKSHNASQTVIDIKKGTKKKEKSHLGR